MKCYTNSAEAVVRGPVLFNPAAIHKLEFVGKLPSRMWTPVRPTASAAQGKHTGGQFDMQRQCIDCKKDLNGHSKPLRCQACAARQRHIDKHSAPPEIVKAVCATCGASVRDYASNRRRNRSGKYYCSNACWHISRRSGKTKGQRDATYYRANADAVRTGANSYYAVNRLKILKGLSDAARRIKAELIREYGGKCECCGESLHEFLTIDHIHGDGAAHRREIGGSRKLYAAIKAAGFPKDRFRLLCFNCNTARGFYGYCPHRPEDKSTVSHRPFKPGRKRIVP